MILPLILFFLLSQLFSCFACDKVLPTKVRKFKTTKFNKVNSTIPLACGLEEGKLSVAPLCVVPVLTTKTLQKKKSKHKLAKGKTKKIKKVKTKINIKTKTKNAVYIS